MTSVNLESFPLCRYFLSEYLSNREDPTNFPPDQCPGILERYEEIFRSALDTLKLTKKELKSRSEFQLSHATPANLESAIAVLRTVEALRLQQFSAIRLLNPPGADLACERDGCRVCCEVKSITKQSSPRDGFFFADQLYEKIQENIAHARKQLQSTTAKLGGAVTMFVCVSNWFDQAIYLSQQDYQYVVNRLEKDALEGKDNYLESLKGIDAVFFVTKFGQIFWFVSDPLKASGFGGSIEQTALASSNGQKS
ncbi:MAG: hypothetical protein WAK56_16845 [Candidatus Sulfotelmatobacter sp.]